MYKASELDLDITVKTLLESELGFLLFISDNTDRDMFSILLKGGTYEDRIGVFGYNTHITCHLFPLMYHKAHENDCDYVKARANALHNVFKRWTDAGYNKYHAKEPFNCKKFMDFINSLEWSRTDYMLLMVD